MIDPKDVWKIPLFKNSYDELVRLKLVEQDPKDPHKCKMTLQGFNECIRFKNQNPEMCILLSVLFQMCLTLNEKMEVSE